EEAAALFRQASSLFELQGCATGKASSYHGEAQAALRLGKVQLAQERSAASIRELRSSVEALSEERPPALGLPRLRELWQFQMECLMALHETGSGVVAPHQALTVLGDWKGFRRRIAMAATAPGELPTGNLPRLAEELRRARETAAVESPEILELLDGSIETWPRLDFGDLPPDTQILAFALGEARSYAWLASRQGMRVFTLPSRVEIDTAAQGFFDLLATSRPGDETVRRRAGEHLAMLLLGELAEYLEGPKLVIVPDGSLHHVPFCALPQFWREDPAAAERYLVEDFSISFLPALDLYRRSPAPAARRAWSRRQLEILVPWEARPRSQEAARRLRAEAEAMGFRTVEIAPVFAAQEPPHRTLVPAFRAPFLRLEPRVAGRPGQERTVLLLPSARARSGSGERLLELSELSSLDLTSELLSLELRPDPLYDTEQQSGLSVLLEGLLLAGARRLLVGLWDLPGDQLSELRLRFFGRLFGTVGPGGREEPGEVLRWAKLSMIADPKWSDPCHWGALQLHEAEAWEETNGAFEDDFLTAGRPLSCTDPQARSPF
ncbi:MAG: CHAT domain-containing protein, partial [Acidobacteria bacterium]|nr:CHAT domain-containing protein [Acidobacteriota bacterium]